MVGITIGAAGQEKCEELAEGLAESVRQQSLDAQEEDQLSPPDEAESVR